MKIMGLLAIALGVFLLRITYLTYMDDPDAMSAPMTEETNPNSQAAMNARYQEQHQRRTVIEIEGMAGGVFLLGGIALVLTPRSN